MNAVNLLSCIGDWLARRPIVPECDEAFWLQNHLEAFYYYYANGQLSAPWKERFAATFNRQSARSMQLEYQWRNVKELLLNAEIRFCPIKGVDLAFRSYPHPALRPMGDFDLLIHPEDCEKTLRLMQDAGWSSPWKQQSCRHHLPMLCKGAFVLELHFKLPGLTTLPAAELFAFSEKDAEGIFRLPLSLNLIMLLAHAMNHQWQNGIRMLLDIMFLLKDREWPTAEIDALCEKWQLPDPQLVRVAFPELFGVTEPHELPRQLIADFREVILEDRDWKDCTHEILMSSSARFTLPWIKNRLKGCSPYAIFSKYGIQKGQYWKMLCCMKKDLSMKLQLLWQYRNGTRKPELRSWVQRVERVQEFLIPRR